jgi:hypothetical protein
MTSIETRRVGFLNWDSDEERERSQKGVAYRQKQKQQKMARRQQDIRNAEEVWNALIDPSKEGTISDFVRNNLVARVFFENFQGLFAAFRRSPLWGRLRNTTLEDHHTAFVICFITCVSRAFPLPNFNKPTLRNFSF